MNEPLAFIGQDASASVAMAALIALVSLLLARRWRVDHNWTPSLAAIRARFSAVTLPAIRLPRLATPFPWRLPRPVATAEPPLADTRHDGPLTIDAQWSRLTSHIAARISAMEQAEVCQRRAASQIDAASYALERLLGELSAVMTLPRPAPALQLLPVEARPQPVVHATQLAA